MGYVRLPAPAVKVVGLGLRTWWKIRKPAMFGVKVLLVHPDDPELCLIVRHSYGESARWGLPGGGYRPERESAESAGAREVLEELGLCIQGLPTRLETTITTLEGKRDTLTILRATPTSASFTPSPEIAEARWVGADISAMPKDQPISCWLTLALSASKAA